MITVGNCVNLLTDVYEKCKVIHDGVVVAHSDGAYDSYWEEFPAVYRRKVRKLEVRDDYLILYI